MRNATRVQVLAGVLAGLWAQPAAAIEGPVVVGPHAVGVSWIESPEQMLHGLAADEVFVFSTLLAIPFGLGLEHEVRAYSRFTGAVVGDLPEPPGGWRFPFMMQCDAAANLLYVWDAGGFPAPPPAVQQPTLYVYRYHGQHAGNFDAHIEQTVDFRATPFVIGWAADIELLPDGSLATADSIFGAIWRLTPSTGAIELVVGPDLPSTLSAPSFFPPLATGFPPPDYDGCCIEEVPYLLGILPGANYTAYRDGALYFTNANHQAIERIAVSVFDDGRTPSARAASIETVTVRPAEDQLEILGGMTFNQYRPQDPWLYVADPWNVRVMRVDIATGARETVLQDGRLFNPTVAVEFAPPLFGVSPLFVSSDQEHRLDLINLAISDGDIFTPPWRISQLFLTSP